MKRNGFFNENLEKDQSILSRKTGRTPSNQSISQKGPWKKNAPLSFEVWVLRREAGNLL